MIAWPRLASGRLDIERRCLPPDVPSCPELRGCTRYATASASSSARELPIGPDGRNRPSLFPFCTATGRNAHAKSLFNSHAGMRCLMVFPPDKIGVYLDWRTQEVGIAAARSGDEALMDAYSER